MSAAALGLDRYHERASEAAYQPGRGVLDQLSSSVLQTIDMAGRWIVSVVGEQLDNASAWLRGTVGEWMDKHVTFSSMFGKLQSGLSPASGTAPYNPQHALGQTPALELSPAVKTPDMGKILQANNFDFGGLGKVMASGPSVAAAPAQGLAMGAESLGNLSASATQAIAAMNPFRSLVSLGR